ncbi:MAG TPA: DUF2190 family protein [Sedimentisphaerales bacterium]|nr:DUF2190 family protein [Thermogutta sp.]HOV77076.1 DUF2190 family protein [Sedimentisphaerales bacterium]HPU34849.1 DUF2190 family protein [Phycisphaerae bacterium]HPZ81783.1 DUF2190 family protein [Thermogutta sp.]
MSGSPLIAGGDILPCRFVRVTGDHQVQQGGDNTPVIGVAGPSAKYPPLSNLVTSNYHARTGDPVFFFGDGEECLIEAGAAFSAGTRLKSDSNGRAVAIATSGTTIQHIGAIAKEAATAAGQLVRCIVKIYSERPALS